MKLRTSRKQSAGLTIVEAVTALAVLGLTAATITIVCLAMNRFAAVSRLQSLATVAARDTVERFISAPNFNPRRGSIPANLVVGTTTQTIPLVAPTEGGGVSINARRTATVSEGSLQNSRRLNVVVEYVFRGRTYQVAMDCFRVPD